MITAPDDETLADRLYEQVFSRVVETEGASISFRQACDDTHWPWYMGDVDSPWRQDDRIYAVINTGNDACLFKQMPNGDPPKLIGKHSSYLDMKLVYDQLKLASEEGIKNPALLVSIAGSEGPKVTVYGYVPERELRYALQGKEL